MVLRVRHAQKISVGVITKLRQPVHRISKFRQSIHRVVIVERCISGGIRLQ